ncbi:Autophagy-related protein [Echinococcus granulosus]|uniref:Autophagy-related protein 101 n=1 Tax=Echinococcus granulosus TaxID=6210 RepID=A0A068W7U0_ECHGR|nr:Autophagy-related protein [Echinococcus granulosus]CDS15869.1 autophagy protein 101 [Echinococcus granulosus]
MDRNPLAELVGGGKGSNAHTWICQNPVDFINTQISDFFTTYFKIHVINSCFFQAFNKMEYGSPETNELIKFAEDTMDMLGKEPRNFLWTVIKLWEEYYLRAARNLMTKLSSMHLFQCTINLLRRITPNEGMSENKLLEGIANAWFETNMHNIMEQLNVPCNNGFKHVFIGEQFLQSLSFKDGAVSYTSYIGIEDVDCKTIDLTYVKVASDPLHERIAGHVAMLAKALRGDSESRCDKPPKGCITLAFVANRKGSWVLGCEPSVWERWVFNVELQSITSNGVERRQELAAQIKGELLYVLDCINTSENSLPELGSSQSECDTVIDFSMPEVSPYRFNLIHFPEATQIKQNKSSGIRRF